MSTTTTNMGMTKPAYTDTADIAIINTDLDTLDAHDHGANSRGLAVARLKNGTNRGSDVPSPIAGSVYLDTSASRNYLYTGAAWLETVMNSTSVAVTLGGGLTVSSGGLTVTAGGLTVTAGGATVTAGGLTVTAGGLTVTAGNIGVGTSAAADRSLNLNSTNLTGTTQYGAVVSSTFSSAATVSGVGVYAQVGTAAAAYTMTNAYAINVKNANKGAGSAITNGYGILVDGQSGGGTNNYGIFISAPSGGSGDNRAIQADGVSLFGSNAGHGIIVDTGNSTPPTTVSNQLGIGAQNATSATAGSSGAVPAQVGGYLVWSRGGTTIKIPYFLN